MAFSDEVVKRVWQKGSISSGNDPNVWRKDECGAWMNWNHYGNRNSQYGWEIDHIKPESEGGSDDISNLRPLQWENNASKSNNRLVCKITANGQNNGQVK